MQPENWPESADYFQFLAGKGVTELDCMLGIPANYDFPASATQSLCSSTFYPWEVSDITDTTQSRALAASKNHKEAEKRRRERINSHLDKLRTILPCNSKTDKASLLAKVVQRVKELKEQTSDLIHLETLPSETDEISINNLISSDGQDKILIKASLCCEDRADLIPDLIKTLRSLSLNPLRAEMATLGGRIRNILVVSGDKGQSDETVVFLRDALKSLVYCSSSSDIGDGSKKRRLISGGERS